MKTREQILAGHPLDARYSAAAELLWDSGLTPEELGATDYEDEVLTPAEFLERLQNGYADYIGDSYGFYHDGEHLTDEPVIPTEEDVRRYIGVYPYLVWRNKDS